MTRKLPQMESGTPEIQQKIIPFYIYVFSVCKLNVTYSTNDGVSLEISS